MSMKDEIKMLLDRILEDEAEASMDLWQYLPSYKDACERHGEHARTHCLGPGAVMVEAAEVFRVLADHESDDRTGLLPSFGCGCSGHEAMPKVEHVEEVLARYQPGFRWGQRLRSADQDVGGAWETACTHAECYCLSTTPTVVSGGGPVACEPPPDALGRAAYDAYQDDQDAADVVPSWVELTTGQRAHWEAAAIAVRKVLEIGAKEPKSEVLRQALVNTFALGYQRAENDAVREEPDNRAYERAEKRAINEALLMLETAKVLAEYEALKLRQPGPKTDESLPNGWEWDDTYRCCAQLVGDSVQTYAIVESTLPNAGTRVASGVVPIAVRDAVDARARRLGLPTSPWPVLLG